MGAHSRARVVRRGATLSLAVALIAGAVADRPPERAPLVLGGYRVLAADFHTHSATWSDGALTPVGLVFEAERQGLDAIAITGHNELFDARVGRWVSSRFGGPIVIVGQEILAFDHHVIALGLTRLVDHRLDVADEIDEVHRQGGVAIAAHPIEDFWPAFDAAAMARLDGSEVCHPLLEAHPERRADLEAFAARASMAAIGSSDYHGTGRMGQCRTYVFVRDVSARGVLDAIRAHHTVVYAPGGGVYGDPALIALAATHDELRREATTDAPPTAVDWISRVCGILGLAGLIVSAGIRRGGL